MRAAAVRAGWLFLCGFLPAMALFYAIGPVALGGWQAIDFHIAYYPAAEAVLSGDEIYPVGDFVLRGEHQFVVDYVYPPLIAVATTPWTLLPVGVAEVVWQALLVVAFFGTLAALGVRDWRCFGLAFLWPPVTNAVATGNVSILLCLAAALVWRFRDRPVLAGANLGVSIAAKVFLWPLVVWLAASRRAAAALWSLVVALGVAAATWGVIGFSGVVDYPDLVRRLSEQQDELGYTVYALAVDLGLPSGLARALWVGLALATLAGVVAFARRGDDRRAFILGLAAAIAFSPIVWLHYFALLLVIVAVAQPRLGLLWFLGLPLRVIVTDGAYNGSTFQTAGVLVVAAVTVGLAVWPPAGWAVRRRVSSEAALRS